MNDLEGFLDAIEAEPGDDGRWRVFADWLEAGGHPLAERVRWAVAEGEWEGCRLLLHAELDKARRLRADCDFVERVLPLFEKLYPGDPSPRQLVEAAREGTSGTSRVDLHARVYQACRVAGVDSMEKRPGSTAAWAVALAAQDLMGYDTDPGPRAALAAVAREFGPKAFWADPGELRPKWLAARDVEYRWQVARMIRHAEGGEAAP